MQTLSAPVWLALGLLGLSVFSLLFAPAAGKRLPLLRHSWMLFFAAAVAVGITGGMLRPVALASIGALFAFCYLGVNAGKPAMRAVFTLLALLVSLGLALHLLPGYHNPVLIKGVQFSAHSAPYTMYANFDKGMIGLALLFFYCHRAGSWKDFASAWKQEAVVCGMLLLAVFALGWGLGFVRPDFKLPLLLPLFAAVNLLLVCVAEEAFFRGVIQDQLTRYGDEVAVAASALLFGAAHLGGGWKWALLASVAGLGYALLYARSRRIEVPIAAHFLVNLIHFTGFTFPQAI